MIAVYGNWCRKSGWNRRRRDGTETFSFDSLTVRVSVYAEGLKYHVGFLQKYPRVLR